MAWFLAGLPQDTETVLGLSKFQRLTRESGSSGWVSSLPWRLLRQCGWGWAPCSFSHWGSSAPLPSSDECGNRGRWQSPEKQWEEKQNLCVIEGSEFGLRQSSPKVRYSPHRHFYHWGP